MDREINLIKQQLKQVKKKRDFFLFFSILLLILLILSFTLLYPYVNEDLLLSIYLVLSVGYLIYIAIIKSKTSYYAMKYQYLKMVSDQEGPIRLARRIYSKNWFDLFRKDGYLLAGDYQKYLYYYQVFDKVSEVPLSGKVIVFLIFAKDENFDFYSDEIDHEINKIRMNLPQDRKIRKQVVLQFTKYPEYDETVIPKLQEIINYKQGDNYLVHLNVGYFVKENMVYYLRPKKAYPNKFYYYATRVIKKYSEEVR